jgi:hypothetical protein
LADLKRTLIVSLRSATQLDLPLILILLFGLANGLLYSCLLPLWEGFDEPFHYAYVNSISAFHEAPTLGKATLSKEIWQSFQLTPLPNVLKQAIPGSHSFDEWLALPESERLAKRKALAALPTALRRQPSEAQNYEAQQAPLAYFVLAPLDWLLSGTPLIPRILTIRLVISLASTLLLACANIALFRALGLERQFQNLALFLIFVNPMTWSAIAHVGNDWLAIPISTAFLAALVVLAKCGGKRDALWLAIFLSAGLLVKAYFLAFIPVFVAALLGAAMRKKPTPTTVLWITAIPLALAGPWYLRNLILYGSASSTQESVGGVGILRTMQAFPHINWPVSLVRLARGGIWTGNWSFLPFPRSLLNVELVIVLVSLGILIARRRTLASPEKWTLVTCAVFLLAMAYQQAAVWAFTGGSTADAEPWYLQCIVPGSFSLTALGLQRGAWAGRWLARFLAITTAGISTVSYLGVLLPRYGGYRGGGKLDALLWLPHGNPSITLSTVALAPPPWLYGLLLTFFAFLAAATTVVVWAPVDRPRPSRAATPGAALS